MRSTEKIIHKQLFFEGMNTVVSPENMKNTMYFYSLNCDIVASDDGNIGVVTNIKGTIQVPVDLPAGENKTIGVGLDEERNKMYFAVWNSNNYHTWYEFDAVSSTVKTILQSITDTGGENIFKWNRNSVILHVDIVQNDLLYWTVEGDEARKFNISKAIDKTDSGYGGVILEDYTRAYKRTSPFPPEAEYFTNETILNNSLYGYLFKFAVQYIYDDGEQSVFSDFSLVPIPSEENSTGVVGVPNKNNGIKVRFLTGGRLVEKVRLAMKKTNSEGGDTDWVSIFVLDKDRLNVPDDSEYEYEFYNNNSYITLDQSLVQLSQSFLPRKPVVQAFAGNAMIYGNFPVGRPTVDVDFSVDVSYEELFIPSDVENELNSPSLVANIVGRSTINNYAVTEVDLIVGPDVVKDNQFFLSGQHSGRTDFTFSAKASLSDNARTIAAQFYSKLANHSGIRNGGYINDITVDASGFAKFRFGFAAPPLYYYYIDVNTATVPVYTNTLKNTGNSVLNDKMGSAYRYGVYYEDFDGRETLVFGNDQLVEVATINEMGEIKKVVTQITINSLPPDWAYRYGIARTENLNQLDYIQVLIQSINTTTVTSIGEEYQDLSLGSLFTYQQVHPNATLRYEFKKGDRLRYIKRVEGGEESVPPNVVDYEILDYFPETIETVNENITIDGTAEVTPATIDSNRINNHIIIDGNEREIIGIGSGGTTYILNSPIGTSGTPETFPSYQIVNKRGILRIKMSDDFPIVVDPDNDIYAIVEVYRPYQSQAISESENYYHIGYKFDIRDGFHIGNIQDQTETQPAIVQIDGLDNYVRNREMIVNNSVTNPNVVLVTVEDPSFSDFYISDLSSYGRATVLDDSRGEVYFDERLVASSNYIEGTSINGLNMFYNLERRDYNDKYGSIELLKFYEGRLYVFKHLKNAWGPIYGRVMTDDAGQPFLSASSNLLPEKLEYFLWEGGVGNNPESVVRDGNDIFGVSPNSGVIFRIGGNGVLPISKIFGIDNEARELIAGASKSGVRMFGGYNRKKGSYILSIPPYDKAAYIDSFSQTNYKVVPIDQIGDFHITSQPSDGNVTISNDVATYSPDFGFSGMDYFSYQAGTGVVRQVCVFVASEETQLVWRGAGQYCVVEGGSRTGFSGYSILEEYDAISQSYTGNTKPNVDTDPDYIAPVEDLGICPIGLEFARIGVLSRDINSQTITFTIQSVDDFNIVIKEGTSYSGSVIAETGVVSSGTHGLNVPLSTGEATVYLVLATSNYAGVTEVGVFDAYFKSARFNDLPQLVDLELNQYGIPSSHGLIFNSLDISSNTSLTTLVVIRHRIQSINLSSHLDISYLDVSYGYALTNLIIGDWGELDTVKINNCMFTENGYSTAFINSFIVGLDSKPTGGTLFQYGSSNSAGIRPSGTVLDDYNSLLSKGWNIIGKAPQSTVTVNLTMDVRTNGPDEYIVWLYLSHALSVDIMVTVAVDVNGGGMGYLMPIDIPSGQTIVSETGSPGGSVFSVSGEITNVTPNPAGGETIIY